jgi:hypothetical protein
VATGVRSAGYRVTRPLAELPYLSPHPLQVGETLIYDVKLGALSAGTQSITVVEETTDWDEPLYRIESEAHTSALLSRIYHFRDHKVTHIRKRDLLPVRYEKQLEDRSYRGDFVVEFDRDANAAEVWRNGKRGADVDVPPDVLDELSMIYYLRSKELRVGDTYEYSFYTGKQLIPVSVLVKSRYYVKVPEPVGKTPVYRLESDDGYVVWITADEHRIPVRIEAPAKLFGKLVATLRTCENVRGLPNHTDE